MRQLMRRCLSAIPSHAAGVGAVDAGYDVANGLGGPRIPPHDGVVGRDDEGARGERAAGAADNQRIEASSAACSRGREGRVRVDAVRTWRRRQVKRSSDFDLNSDDEEEERCEDRLLSVRCVLLRIPAAIPILGEDRRQRTLTRVRIWRRRALCNIYSRLHALYYSNLAELLQGEVESGTPLLSAVRFLQHIPQRPERPDLRARVTEAPE